jgi:CspA family cold shock protein
MPFQLKPVARENGIVKFFNADKGFGFISRDGGKADVFLHANACTRSGWVSVDLKQGDRLEFDVVEVAGKNPKAANIKRAS